MPNNQERSRIFKLQGEFQELLHAVQSGVKVREELDLKFVEHGGMEKGEMETSHKHLRTGINARACECAALQSLLVEKGIITIEEVLEKVNFFLRKDVTSYEEHLSSRLGKEVKLG